MQNDFFRHYWAHPLCWRAYQRDSDRETQTERHRQSARGSSIHEKEALLLPPLHPYIHIYIHTIGTYTWANSSVYMGKLKFCTIYTYTSYTCMHELKYCSSKFRTPPEQKNQHIPPPPPPPTHTPGASRRDPPPYPQRAQ